MGYDIYRSTLGSMETTGPKEKSNKSPKANASINGYVEHMKHFKNGMRVNEQAKALGDNLYLRTDG